MREHTSRGRARIMVRVVISRTTLVPAVSFSLSTLLRQPTTYLGPLLALTITGQKQHQAPLSKNIMLKTTNFENQNRKFTMQGKSNKCWEVQSSLQISLRPSNQHNRLKNQPFPKKKVEINSLLKDDQKRSLLDRHYSMKTVSFKRIITRSMNHSLHKN